MNGLFETFFEMASGVETITGPASSRYGANAMHGVINVISNPINSDSKLYTNIGPNNYKNFKVRTGNKKDWSLDGFFSRTITSCSSSVKIGGESRARIKIKFFNLLVMHIPSLVYNWI